MPSIEQLALHVQFSLLRVWWWFCSWFTDDHIQIFIWFNIIYASSAAICSLLILISFCIHDEDQHVEIFKAFSSYMIYNTKSVEVNDLDESVEFWMTFSAFQQVNIVVFLFSCTLVFATWRLRSSLRRGDLVQYEESCFITSCLFALLCVPYVVKTRLWYLDLVYGDFRIVGLEVMYFTEIILNWKILLNLERRRWYGMTRAAPAA